MPSHLKELNIHITVIFLFRYYGCGLVAPDVLHGLDILDLGCGVGTDCFVLSRLVGPAGHVMGVDMTQEQVI